MTSKPKMFQFRTLAVILTLGLIGASLTACTEPHCNMKNQSSESSVPVQVAAVLAPTDNFVDFETIIKASESHVLKDLGGELKGNDLKDALGRELSVIIADGVPQLAAKRSVKALGDAEYDRQQAIKQTFGSFNLVASCAAGDLKIPNDQIPTDVETDLLAGLAIAADQFNVEGAEKRLYVLANGIQTAGAIAMQEPGKFPKSEAYASQLAEGLESINALPDLHGATVYWYGLGQVDGSKQKLDQSARDSLIYFWQEVITRSNGIMATENIFGQVGSGLPHKNSIEVTSMEIKTCQLMIKLYEKDGVKFEPDSDTFLDPSKAKSAAKTVAEAFKKASCDSMTIFGYAAAGMSKSEYDKSESIRVAANKLLTEFRAKAFADLVKSAGFTGKIKIIGKGTCSDNWNDDGSVNESKQKLCRRVEVSN